MCVYIISPYTDTDEILHPRIQWSRRVQLISKENSIDLQHI